MSLPSVQEHVTLDKAHKALTMKNGFLAVARPARAHASSNHATIRWLVGMGWIGLFGVALLDACPIPLPVPGTTDLLLLVLVVHKSSPWLLVPLAVSGAIVGGLLTWSAGKKGGEKALRRYVPSRYYNPITRWVKAHGAIAVALAAVLPPPIPLMPFLVAAGALGLRRRRFLAAFSVARTLRYSIVAWLGVEYGRHMVRWWNRYLSRYEGTISWLILSLFLAALAWGIWKWRSGNAQPAAEPATT
jgi:membrane protein YqaA with SNARE-associated domain